MDQYNEHCSSVDKAKLHDNSYRSRELFQYQLNIPSVTNITIKCKVVLPDSETKEVNMGAVFDYSYGYNTKEVKYTPQYKKKNIMGWVEIENSSEFGFNLWLVQTDGMYGDWYILRNKNNGIYMTKKGLQTCLNLILIFTPLQADMPVVTPSQTWQKKLLRLD